jgi:hypothetical protein
METSTKEKQKNANFHRVYKSVSRFEKQNVIVRNEIIKRCGITEAIFYLWLNGTTEIPFLAKPIIAEVLKTDLKTLFPD